ncbi:MAG TPA: hypothetical protein VJV79_13445 [Polyangiaceae bacterium]|nr:hypothetical protein [Polyangiaceae bacterium]
MLGGAAFCVADRWSRNTIFRYGNWFLPKTAAVDPFLDEASLTGRNTIFNWGSRSRIAFPCDFLMVAKRVPSVFAFGVEVRAKESGRRV